MKSSLLILCACILASDAHAGAFERMQSQSAERERADRSERAADAREERRAARVENQQREERRLNSDYLCSERPKGCMDRWSHGF